MKIRLIEPEPPGMHVWAKVLLPRLGLPIIAAALKEHGHDVLVYNPTMAPIDWDDVNTSDLVGLSSTTSTAIDRLRVRRRPARTRHPGRHRRLARDLHGRRGARARRLRRPRRGRRAAHARAHRGARRRPRARHHRRPLVHARRRRGAQPAARSPAPTSTSCRSPTCACSWAASRLTTMPIMTSWGCPFDCTFCSVTAMFGKKYRFRSAESVIAELKDKRPQRIFFYDDNMAAEPQAAQDAAADDDRRGSRDPLVCPGAHRRGPRPRSCSTSCSAQGASSSTSASSRSTRRRWTGSRSRRPWTTSRTAIRILHDYGIKSHGMFVLGADSDDVQTVRDTVAFAIKNKIDTVMLNILTPLPGHARSSRSSTRPAASSTSAGSSTTPTTSSSSRRS